MTPHAITQAILADFGRGDVAAILARCHPDIEWEYGMTVEHDVPWYQQRRGREAAAGFFTSLADVTWHRFEPKRLLADGNLVVLLLDADYTVAATGRRVVYDDAVMLFWYDDAGRLVRFAHRVDMLPAFNALHAR